MGSLHKLESYSSASKIVLHYDDTSMGNFQKKRATTLSCNPFLAV